PAAAWQATRRRLRATRPRQWRRAASSSFLLLHMRRARRHGTARGRAAPGLHFLVPEEVVLLRPGLVAIAVAHVAVGVLDADGAHVDVPKPRRDVQHR